MCNCSYSSIHKKTHTRKRYSHKKRFVTYRSVDVFRIESVSTFAIKVLRKIVFKCIVGKWSNHKCEPKKKLLLWLLCSAGVMCIMFFLRTIPHTPAKRLYCISKRLKKEKILSALVIDTIDWFSIQAWGIFTSSLWILWRRASRHPSMT